MSEWEGFGLVVLESLSFCKPIFVSNVPGVKELVFSKQMLINNNSTAKKKAETILDGITYFNKHKEAFLACSIKTLDTNSLEKFMNSMNDIYNEDK